MRVLLTMLVTLVLAATVQAREQLIATHTVTFDVGPFSSQLAPIDYRPHYKLMQSTVFAGLVVTDWQQWGGLGETIQLVDQSDVGRTFTLDASTIHYPWNGDWLRVYLAIRDQWPETWDTGNAYLMLDDNITNMDTALGRVPSSAIVNTPLLVSGVGADNPLLQRIDYTLERWDTQIVWRSDWWAQVADIPEPETWILLVGWWLATQLLCVGRSRDRAPRRLPEEDSQAARL